MYIVKITGLHQNPMQRNFCTCARALLCLRRVHDLSPFGVPMGVNSSREPQPMCFHAAVDFRQKLYIWGGLRLPSTVHNSMLETFDVPSEKWQQPQKLRGSLLPDDLCAMAVARDSEKAYFFGGVSFSSSKAARTRDSENPRFFGGVSDSSSNLTFFNTLYQLNLSTLECKELVPRNPSQAPVKQCGSGMVFFKDKLVVQGGYTGKDCSNELYTFDLKNSECEESNLCSCSCMYHTHLYSRLDHALQDCAVNKLPTNADALESVCRNLMPLLHAYISQWRSLPLIIAESMVQF